MLKFKTSTIFLLQIAVVNSLAQAQARADRPPCGKCIWHMTDEELEEKFANDTEQRFLTEEEIIEREERCGCKGPVFSEKRIDQLYAQIDELTRQHPDLFPPVNSSKINQKKKEQMDQNKQRRKRYSGKIVVFTTFLNERMIK